jgi:hypothetical protein
MFPLHGKAESQTDVLAFISARRHGISCHSHQYILLDLFHFWLPFGSKVDLPVD